MRGYEELRSGAAWLEVSTRGKIVVSGEDRARLLHAMTTNHIQQLSPGTGCYAFFLSAQGRILADVNVLCRADSLLLDTEPETRGKILEHLDRFIIADDVTLQDLTPELSTIAVEGPRSSAVLNVLGAPVPDVEYGHADWAGGLVARLNISGGAGFSLIVPNAEKEALTERLAAVGAVAADQEAFEVVRLENGKARYGHDFSERYLAQEVNLPQAMHYQKGCYLGQEIVERVRSRGQIHRLLKPLEIEGWTVPEPGTKLVCRDGAAAEITSAAYSPAWEKVVALGYVRADPGQLGAPTAMSGLHVRVRD